jgi:EAL domain-containing protein (putative c-di-GMP-specific phosphodiesterase class I)
MYEAKTAGRNAVRSYSAGIGAENAERLTLRRDLEGAQERGELEVHYQPLVDVSSGKVVGAEALLRWRHPSLGLVMPSTFIPIAEESGIIRSIGEWVLRAACAQAIEWHDAGATGLRMSVNVSARQFDADSLPEKVAGALAESGLPSQCLELEITESTAMQDSGHLQQTLADLRVLGVRLALDDFGSGYSSLNHLKRFPIDTLKVDRSFIHDLSESVDSRTIVSAIVRLAHSLGFKVVAEGVESREQLEFLKSQSCDEMQGFLFSPAVSAADFGRILAAPAQVLPHRP